MYKFIKKISSLFLAFFIMISINSDLVYSVNTFSQVVEGFDWGPCVTKMIIKLDKEVSVGKKGILSESSFSVITTKRDYTSETATDTEERKVLKAYTSDEKGNYINKLTNYITLELLCNPDAGNPFFYNIFDSLTNIWSVPYKTKITLKNDITLGQVTLSSNKFSVLEQPKKNHLILIDDFFVNGTHTYAGETLGYAYYKCTNKKNKGLVIWIHGMGEGGKDTTIVLLGNKVTALVNKTIQYDLNNNCDILIVQTPIFWMNYYETGKDRFVPNKYTETFKSLVDKYVSENNIQQNRIYIGGCSMGGYMTMNMILNYPNYFSAAYFVAEAYEDEYISDEQIESIKHIPMWFIHAENDGTVDVTKTTNATIERLKKANAKEIHYSYYIDVVDTSRVYDYVTGSQYKYDPHWSWVYLFNDECKDNGETVFTWLSKINRVILTKKKDDTDSVQLIKNSIFISILLFAFIF
jgi:predicted peptidase